MNGQCFLVIACHSKTYTKKKWKTEELAAFFCCSWSSRHWTELESSSHSLLLCWHQLGTTMKNKPIELKEIEQWFLIQIFLENYKYIKSCGASWPNYRFLFFGEFEKFMQTMCKLLCAFPLPNFFWDLKKLESTETFSPLFYSYSLLWLYWVWSFSNCSNHVWAVRSH